MMSSRAHAVFVCKLFPHSRASGGLAGPLLWNLKRIAWNRCDYLYYLYWKSHTNYVVLFHFDCICGLAHILGHVSSQMHYKRCDRDEREKCRTICDLCSFHGWSFLFFFFIVCWSDCCWKREWRQKKKWLVHWRTTTTTTKKKNNRITCIMHFHWNCELISPNEIGVCQGESWTRRELNARIGYGYRVAHHFEMHNKCATEMQRLMLCCGCWGRPVLTFSHASNASSVSALWC